MQFHHVQPIAVAHIWAATFAGTNDELLIRADRPAATQNIITLSAITYLQGSSELILNGWNGTRSTAYLTASYISLIGDINISGGSTFSVDITTPWIRGALRIGGTSYATGSTVWHAGNLNPANYAPLASPVFSGTPKVGASTIYHTGNLNPALYAPLAGAAFTGAISTSSNITTAGLLYINNASGSGTIGAQNTSYFHFMTDRANFYFQKPIIVDDSIGSYDGDMYIARAGTNRIQLATWGTYVFNHLTIEDVFAFVNLQPSIPNTPVSGAKLYVYNNGGTVQLRIKFANGIDKFIAQAN